MNAHVMMTPSTYQGSEGRQYVVLTAGGGALTGPAKNDETIAFALPKQ